MFAVNWAIMPILYISCVGIQLLDIGQLTLRKHHPTGCLLLKKWIMDLRTSMLNNCDGT